jgi:hypothetical protein
MLLLEDKISNKPRIYSKEWYEKSIYTCTACNCIIKNYQKAKHLITKKHINNIKKKMVSKKLNSPKKK